MRNVLFLLRSFGIGGAERQLIVLAAGLQQNGYSVKIAVFYTGGPMQEEAERMGIQIVDLKRKGRWDLVSFLFRLICLIKNENPDILHSYLQVPNIWAALIKLVLPRTKVIWGVRASNMDMKQYNWQWGLTDRVESLLSKFPNWIICNSQAGLLYHAGRGYPKRKMNVIHNGIDTTSFFPDRELGKSVRLQWGIQDREKLIGMVARIDPMKDYPNFLKTAALLIQERKDLRFVCVGGGSEKHIREYTELAHSLKLEKHLLWAGERKDMIHVYNALDIFVLPSANGEGFSNAIGEAMACGIPCVATDVGDARQLIGDSGEIVIPGNPEELKQGVLKLLDQLDKNGMDLNTRARKRIVDQFSISRLVSRTNNIFKKLMYGDGGTESDSGIYTKEL